MQCVVSELPEKKRSQRSDVTRGQFQERCESYIFVCRRIWPLPRKIICFLKRHDDSNLNLLLSQWPSETECCDRNPLCSMQKPRQPRYPLTNHRPRSELKCLIDYDFQRNVWNMARFLISGNFRKCSHSADRHSFHSFCSFRPLCNGLLYLI